MRATFAFLPYNQDEVNKREYADKVKWRAENPTLPESDYPGMPDLYGRKTPPKQTQAEIQADIDKANCERQRGRYWDGKYCNYR
jgi:hypothetical protein